MGGEPSLQKFRNLCSFHDSYGDAVLTARAGERFVRRFNNLAENRAGQIGGIEDIPSTKTTPIVEEVVTNIKDQGEVRFSCDREL